MYTESCLSKSEYVKQQLHCKQQSFSPTKVQNHIYSQGIIHSFNRSYSSGHGVIVCSHISLNSRLNPIFVPMSYFPVTFLTYLSFLLELFSSTPFAKVRFIFTLSLHTYNVCRFNLYTLNMMICKSYDTYVNIHKLYIHI